MSVVDTSRLDFIRVLVGTAFLVGAVLPACSSINSLSCESKTDCRESETCIEGQCTPLCVVDLQCPIGMRCENGACLNADCVGAECQDQTCQEVSDCRDPQGHPSCETVNCSEGRCVYEIHEGAECEPARCDDGVSRSSGQCTAAGLCSEPIETSCSGYQCDLAGEQCRDRCDSSEDCLSGYICGEGDLCTVRPGTGEACTGQGQGSCPENLQCENGVCCDAASATCCSEDAHCSGGLACDAPSSSCFDTCVDFSSSRCSNQNSVCVDDACVPKKDLGEQCLDSRDCLSGFCADSVCCDAGCGGTCLSCVQSLTGIADGFCSPTASGSTDSTPSPNCTLAGDGCDSDSCECDGAGLCKGSAEQPCTDDEECATNVCECADAACSSRRCSENFCGVCEYTSNGSICLPGLGSPIEVKDAQDCTEEYSCYVGSCLKDVGQSCAIGSECGSGFCECADTDCATRVCAVSQCGPCLFTDSGQLCDGILGETAPTEDDEDCSGDQSCYAGLCLSDLGAACVLSEECESGVCECADASCQLKRCVTVPCGVCDYSPDGVSCVGGLGSPDPIEDIEDCAADALCYAGVCLKNLGASCDSAAECEADFCECNDSGCTQKVCSDVGCDACSFTPGGTLCEGHLDALIPCDDLSPVTSPDACDGAGSCVGLTQRGLLARYYLDEAASGPGPGTVLDSAPTPLNLSTVYDGGNPSYSELTTGRGLHWTTSGSLGRVCTDVPGTKIMSLDGKTEGTLEAVINLEACEVDLSRILQIGFEWGWTFTMGCTSYGEINFIMNSNFDYQIRWQIDMQTRGRGVLTMVLDSTLPVPEDRAKLYLNGVEQLPFFLHQRVPLNATIDMAAQDNDLCIGNREYGGLSDKSLQGDIFYGAFYDVALTAQEAANNAAVLIHNDDPF